MEALLKYISRCGGYASDLLKQGKVPTDEQLLKFVCETVENLKALIKDAPDHVKQRVSNPWQEVWDFQANKPRAENQRDVYKFLNVLKQVKLLLSDSDCPSHVTPSIVAAACKQVSLHITRLSGQVYDVSIAQGSQGSDVKQRIEKDFGVKHLQQKLIYGTQELEDTARLPEGDDIDLTLLLQDAQIAKLMKDLSHSAPWVRKNAVIALGKKGESAQPASRLLLAMAQDSGNANEIREEAFRALGKLGDLDTVVIEGLHQFIGSTAHPQIVPPDPFLLLAAAEALAQLQHEEGVEALRKFLGHDDDGVRLNAAKAFRNFGKKTVEKFSDKVIPALLAIGSNVHELGAVQTAAMETLSKIDAAVVKGSARDIFQIAQDRRISPFARRCAIHALMNCGEAADEFVDDVLVLAQGDGIYAGATQELLYMQIAAADFVARHGRITAAIEVLIDLSASSLDLRLDAVNLYCGLSYKKLVEDGVLDEKDLSGQQLKSLKLCLTLKSWPQKKTT